MQPLSKWMCWQNPSGLGSILYTTPWEVPEGSGMHGASRLALPRLPRTCFLPLAKLGPLGGGCRTLSEDFRAFRVL